MCDIDGICYLFSPSSFNFHQELDPLKAVDLETTAKVKVPDEITQADENNDMATVSRRKAFYSRAVFSIILDFGCSPFVWFAISFQTFR